MAQGCHLIYSDSDRGHFNVTDRPPRTREEAVKGALHEMGLQPQRADDGLFRIEGGALSVMSGMLGHLEVQTKVFKERFETLPPEDQTTLTQVAMTKTGSQFHLLTGFGNPDLSSGRALALPGALDRIFKHTPDAPGLFSPCRSGASSWISTLKTRGRGAADGYAAEVIASAGLMDRPATSLGGKKLSIGSHDQISFGHKLQASYGGGGPIAVPDDTALTSRSVFNQPYRGRIEADLVITRPTNNPLNPFETRDIGVDFKTSSRGRAMSVEPSQLEGALVALQTGFIDEFHFVTNTRFDRSTKTNVDEINRRIETYNSDPSLFDIVPIELFEGVAV